MSIKKNKILENIILLLFTIVFLATCRGNDMHLEKILPNFSRLIEGKKIDDLRLRIYYISPFIFTRAPLSVDDLITRSYEYEIIVIGSELKKHISLLNQFCIDTLIPVDHKSRVDARLYYVFETKKGHKILDVSMWGDNDSIFVNGFEVKGNDAFYNVVIPFMPEYAVKDLEAYLGKIEVSTN